MTSAERAARIEAGARARETVPYDALAAVDRTPGRDAVHLVLGQEASRIAALVPLRRERMAASPFAFYRGTAAVMASDLERTPNTGITAQLCGDAHAANFGLFGSPERRLLFDLNDFDETLPGPFEWDLKRLVASLELAGRAAGLKRKARSHLVTQAAGAYREAMRGFTVMSELDVWYSRADVEDTVRAAATRSEGVRHIDKIAKRARQRTQLRSLSKLTTIVEGERRFVADPPLVQPLATLAAATPLTLELTTLLDDYRHSLDADRRHLVERYHVVDLALKVVGVGSVGTRCWIVLLQGVDADDAIVLQAKEATTSVLEPYAEPSPYAQHGERVVRGQRLMQAASDLMLGWQQAQGADGMNRDYYVRQLHDWKGGVIFEELTPDTLAGYGRLCAWVLARAHARSGDRFAIAGYLGAADGTGGPGGVSEADQVFAEFAAAYADLAEADHAEFVTRIRDAAALDDQAVTSIG